MENASTNSLGSFLKDRRLRLDPASFGFSGTRRRTPGLRREEVAQLVSVSTTWYTWLEQGRGGAPSAEVLNRLARGLMLTASEREHLFMLGRGHPPDVKYQAADAITPRLQRLLDALEVSPGIVRTSLWDVVAWNRAAAVVLTDYSTVAPAERNILRQIFCSPRVRRAQDDWEGVARFVVGAFKADVIRAGAGSEATALVKELSERSEEFRSLWQGSEIHPFGDGTKRLRHPELGLIELEYSGFAIDGRQDLHLVVYNPASSGDADRIRSLINSNGQV